MIRENIKLPRPLNELEIAFESSLDSYLKSELRQNFEWIVFNNVSHISAHIKLELEEENE